MNSITHRLDGRALAQADGVVEIGVHAALLGVDLDEAEVVPDAVDEVV